LRAALAAQWTEAVLAARFGAGGWGWEDDMADASEDAGGTSGTRSWSATNVQEPGVDEADLVKTDGTYLYVTPPDRSLAVVRAWPPESLTMDARVDLGVEGASLLREGVSLLALGTRWDIWPAYDPDSAWRGTWGTRLRWLEVADAVRPRTTRVIDVEGWPLAARSVNGRAWIVLAVPMTPVPAAWELVWADDVPNDPDAARPIVAERVRALLDALPDEALLPRMARRVPEEAAQEPLLTCADLWAPEHAEPGATPGMVAILETPIAASAEAPRARGLVAAGDTVYMTPSSLTVAQGRWPVLYDGVVARSMDEPRTALHRFTLGGGLAYAGSGEVEGQLLTPWALDEHEGHLRVVTTYPEGGTDVSVLELGKRRSMELVGALRGVAPGESMRSVRFDGDRAWLVTFRQVDPLFTLDLSEPRAPRVVGELKVPGYSAYLHPMAGDRLLGVGLAGTPDGRLTGVDVSLFDVSDPSAPARLDELVVSDDAWSGSEALQDPRAFTFFDGVAAIPVHMQGIRYTEDDVEARVASDFAGLVVVEVGEDGLLRDLGRVGHVDLVDPAFGAGLPMMRRSVVIEDVLYSVSDVGLKASGLRTPSDTLGSVVFQTRWP
jgi:hypothetical protein